MLEPRVQPGYAAMVQLAKVGEEVVKSLFVTLWSGVQDPGSGT